MTTTKRRNEPQDITSWQHGRFTDAVRGPTPVLLPMIERLTIPWQWDARQRCYLLPRARIDDLLAALELDGRTVHVQMAGWS